MFMDERNGVVELTTARRLAPKHQYPPKTRARATERTWRILLIVTDTLEPAQQDRFFTKKEIKDFLARDLPAGVKVEFRMFDREG